MEGERLMALARKKRLQNGYNEYRSPYFVALPPPSELLLSKSLADLAETVIRNTTFKRQIVQAAHTIHALFKQHPKQMRGKFLKSLNELRTAIRNLPQEDVDPEYFSIVEDQTMAKFEGLQNKIASALAWSKEVAINRIEPPKGVVAIKVIADAKQNILSILIDDRKTNMKHLFEKSVELRERLRKSLQELGKAPLPELTKTAVRKAFKRVIYCFSLEASVPYEMKNDIETLLELLDRPCPLDVELVTSIKTMQTKTANCLKYSQKYHYDRSKALLFVYNSFDNLDKILTETTRSHWMMDMPDTYDRRRLPLVSELLSYIEELKKKFNIKPEKKRYGCLCYRQVQYKKGPRAIPLSPELLSYAEEFRRSLGVPPLREDGICYCPWIYRVPEKRQNKGIGELFRLYVKSISTRAKARDAIKDTTMCFCCWMQMQRIFAGLKKDSCY